MIIVPGQPGKDLCDPSLGVTRRDVLRVGGSGLLGMSLGTLFTLLVIPSIYVLIAKQHAGEEPGAIGRDFEIGEPAMEPAAGH